jgi:hypothetical protein
MIRERKKERERVNTNALLTYHGSGPGHPVPSPSRDRLHFPRSFVVSLRLSVKVLFVCVCKREQKRVNFVSVFRADFSLKSR